MRKILVIVTIVFGAILLVGCKNKDTQEINKGEEKNIYALSSLASIDSIMEHEVNLKKRSLDQDIVEEIKEVELDYKSIIDGVLNGQSPMTVKETILEEADEYDKLIEITLNLEGEKMVYELYLIETLVSEETKEDESEKSYKLTGKIIIGEKEYQISGKKEVEIEEDETEFEIELKVSMDENKYSIIKYEDETETEDGKIETEKEFKQKIYENDELVAERKFDYESEDGKTTFKIVIITGEEEKIYKFILLDNHEILVKINGEEICKININEEGLKEYHVIETEASMTVNK